MKPIISKIKSYSIDRPWNDPFWAREGENLCISMTPQVYSKVFKNMYSKVFNGVATQIGVSKMIEEKMQETEGS